MTAVSGAGAKPAASPTPKTDSAPKASSSPAKTSAASAEKAASAPKASPAAVEKAAAPKVDAKAGADALKTKADKASGSQGAPAGLTLQPVASGVNKPKPDVDAGGPVGKPDPAPKTEPVVPTAPVTPAPPPRPTMIPPVGEGGISSGYGEREPASNINRLPNGKEMHFGIDYARPAGTPIKAAADGVVVKAGWNNYGAGNEVVIDHGLDDQGKRTYSRYMHQSAVQTTVGAEVKQGDTIGQVGTTGASSGNHLHFQVSHDTYGSNDNVVDPNPYLSGARSFPGRTGGSAPAPAPDPAPTPPPGESPAGKSYTVQPGDTLGVIASRHGKTLDQVIAANRATIPNPNRIYPGQQITIDGGSAAPAAAVIAPRSSSYTVRPGDTMGAIASRNGIGLEALARANSATVPNPNRIYPGQQLQLPGAGGGPAADAPPAPPTTPPTPGAVPTGAGASRAEVDAFIGTAAGAYGADAGVLSRIAQLESNYDTGDIANNWDSNAAKGTPSKGMFQFIEPTFQRMAPAAKAANPEAWAALGELNWTDWRQQALTTAWAITHGRGSEWATYYRAGGK